MYYVAVWIFFLSGSLWAQQAESPAEQAFRKGLEREARFDEAEAVELYLEAMAFDASFEAPKERIRGIIRRRVNQEREIEEIKKLLPAPLVEEFESAGVFEPAKPRGTRSFERTSQSWDWLIWLGIALGLLVPGFLLWRKLKVQKQEEEEQRFFKETKKTRVGREPQQKPMPEVSNNEEVPKPNAPPKKASQDYRVAGVQKERIVTDKTKEQIGQMIDSVSSLDREKLQKDEAPSVSDQELEKSDLVQALADTLISEVKTDEDENQLKYSKMTLDASLVFEEEDVSFFEKEFDASASDIEKARRKEEKGE